MYYQDLTILSDSALIASLKSLALEERKCQVSILRHLREMDKRRLADKAGFPSLFEYCVRELRYMHASAARLVHASRAAAKYPVLYRTLERGLLSVTTISMLAPHLTRGNYSRLIRSSMGRSAREIEALIASLTPLPAIPAERVRFIAVPSVPPIHVSLVESPDLFTAPINSPASPNESIPMPATTHASEPVVPVVQPVSIQPVATTPTVIRRVHFSFTADEELLRDVERVKELSRHKWPAGRLEDVFAGAIKALLENIDPDLAKSQIKNGRSGDAVKPRIRLGERRREIPRSVKNAVWRRDGGRCTYKSADGRSCSTRSNLEFDHIQPWALGGRSDNQANVRLLCRAHNDLEARLIFGSAGIDAAVNKARSTVT